MKKFIDESWLVLMLGVVFALLLAGTNSVVLGQIQSNERAELLSAINEVVPGLESDAKSEKLKEPIARCDVYRCINPDGTLVGWAVEGEGTGFIDKITIVVGLAPAGDEITGMKVIKHLETPGLGNKIDTKGEENPYPLQYEGVSTDEPLQLVKGTASEPQQIAAITGATYSSQYVMDIVNRIIEQVVPNLPKQ